METEKVETQQKKEPKIEFETVTLRLPKKLMDFLRKTPGGYGPNPTAYLEHLMVDVIRADLEAATGEEIITWNGLGPVFREILNDKRFDP